MKKIKIFTIITIILLGISCNTDNLTDLDIPIVGIDNTKLDKGQMFANAVLGSSNSIGAFNKTQFPSAYVQYLASYSVSLPGDRYIYDSGYNDDAWGGYENQIKLLVHLTELLKADPSEINNFAMVRIMKVFAFHSMTDTYGDIPYFEAGQAFFQGDFFPVYDEQQIIYMDMLKELDEATSSFNDALSSFGDNDILFQGDLNKWKKFGYSLMLRLAMRISNVDSETAQNYIAKAVKGGVLSSNEETIYLRHTDGPADINRNSRSRGFVDSDSGKYFKLGETFVNWLKNTNDPRLMVYSGGMIKEEISDFSSDDLEVFWFDDTKWNFDPEVQRGHPHGTTIVSLVEDYGITTYEQLQKTFSRINPLLVQYNSPQVFINFAEVEFLMAEASLRGLYSGNAEEFYNIGIRAAMTQYGLYDSELIISETNIQKYISLHPFDASIGEQMIGEQLWLALFQNGQEAWSNWRRTGYPNLNSVISGIQIPVRYQYVQAEVAQNGDNVSNAISKQGADNFDTKIWWDK